MADAPASIGFLLPLVDNTASSIPIYEGINSVGRNNLAVSDKRVSRNHISLHASNDGSAEVMVEGPNPIILKSRGQRKKLVSQDKCLISNGDILELIPGNHLFKYVTGGSHNDSLSESGCFSNKRKRQAEDDSLTVKSCQILEDEAGTRALLYLNEEPISAISYSTSVIGGSGGSQSNAATTSASLEGAEPIRNFRVPKDRLSYIFRLMRVQGLPAWANTSSVSIEDVIQGNLLVAVLSNYMVDIDWLMSACPDLRKIPNVLVVHGESGATVEYLKRNKPANWILHKPPLPISYGTHHSKAMLLVYPTGVRVIVHTANLIYVDWNNKTQGLWMQDFPWKDKNSLSKESLFENDLIDYLNALKWPGFNIDHPVIGNVTINASFFKKFDYSSAMVRLIASVPGYHTGSNLKKWGHMKMRSVLEDCIFDKEFCKAPLVYQFSSLGSLDEKWLAEFGSSLSAGVTSDKSPLGIGKPRIIWPTVEDVRCSLEGYRAGNAIPSPQKNVEKDFLKMYWAKWKANHVGRCRAMPHIKSYTRYNGQSLAWFLLTSANLSKAAWGALQKNNSQLMIRSYELGVLFLPSTIEKPVTVFSCTDGSELKQRGGIKTKLATLCYNENRTAQSSEIIKLPVPYQLPPQPYTSEDVPWSWDRRYTKKDVYGQTWPLQS